MVNSVLEQTASPLEKNLDKVSGHSINRLNLPIETLWNANTCPSEYLIYLAKARGVKVWRDSWGAAVKRQVIKAARNNHKQIGTIASVKAAVAAFGAGISIEPWYEINGEPGTFEARYTASPLIPNTPQFQLDVAAAIDATKPLYAHYNLVLGVVYASTINIHSALRVAGCIRFKTRIV